MRYVDSGGRVQRLTREQAVYLAAADRIGFAAGWGGLKSTLTVRILAERGLITLQESGGTGRWRVLNATPAGRRVLADWRAQSDPAKTP